MIANFLRIDSFEKLPKEIQTEIFKNLVGQDSNIFFTKKVYRKDYLNSLQAETDLKMGLYERCLQLEKILKGN